MSNVNTANRPAVQREARSFIVPPRSNSPLIAQVATINSNTLKAMAQALSTDPRSNLAGLTFAVTLPSGQEVATTADELIIVLVRDHQLTLTQAVSVLYGLHKEKPTPDGANKIPLKDPKTFAQKWRDASQQEALSLQSAKSKNPLEMLFVKKPAPPDSPEPHRALGVSLQSPSPETSPSHNQKIRILDAGKLLRLAGKEISGILNLSAAEIGQAVKELQLLNGE